jgi:hypothetical protein
VDKVKGEMRLLVKSLGPEGILLAEDVPPGRNIAFFSAKPRDLGFKNLVVRRRIGAQREIDIPEAELVYSCHAAHRIAPSRIPKRIPIGCLQGWAGHKLP